MAIVGHKIEQYLTAVRIDGHFEVTTHRVVTELHATKGWRQTRHSRRVQNLRNLPNKRVLAQERFVLFEHAPPYGNGKLPKWSRPDFTITPEALLRHRERRRDNQIAWNIAEAKKEDQRLAGLR